MDPNKPIDFENLDSVHEVVQAIVKSPNPKDTAMKLLGSGGFPKLYEAVNQFLEENPEAIQIQPEDWGRLTSIFAQGLFDRNGGPLAKKRPLETAAVTASDDDKFVTIYFKPGFTLENDQVFELEKLLGREIGMGFMQNNDFINVYTSDPALIEKAKEFLGPDNIEEIAEPEQEINSAKGKEWYIYDWAGNEIDAGPFADFEDAWSWIYEKHPDDEEAYQEYDVRKKAKSAVAAPEAEPAQDWMDEERFMVSKTYDVIDPGGEAIKNGEPEESGFVWEDKKMSANDLLSELNNHFGFFENLDENSDKDQSLYATDPERDYKTGTETMYALHISGAPEDMKKLVPVLKGEARPATGAMDVEAGQKQNAQIVQWIETMKEFGQPPDSAWASGNVLNSYNTTIAKRDGRTLYVNDAKYSSTTSRLQKHLVDAAGAAGLKVVMKPQEFFGTDMPRKLTYDEVRRRAASVEADWRTTPEDIALFCIHDQGLYNALEACKTYNDFERLAQQAVEVYNGVTKSFEERHFQGDIHEVVDALMEVKSAPESDEDEDEIESAAEGTIPGKVVVRHGCYMVRYLGEGPLNGKHFHLGHDEAENEKLGKELFNKDVKFEINEMDDAVDVVLAATSDPEIEKTLEHNQGAPEEMVEKAAQAAGEGYYLDRLAGIAEAVGSQLAGKFKELLADREAKGYKPPGQDQKSDQWGRELMISLIDGGWTKEQLKRVAWGLPFDALKEFNLVDLREKGSDSERSNNAAEPEAVEASTFDFSDQASQEAALKDFLEWMMEGRIENDRTGGDFDPNMLGHDVEDQLTGVSGEVNGQRTNDIYRALTQGMTPERISEIAEDVPGIDRIDDGWAYYDAQEYAHKVAQKPAHAATAAADSDMVDSYLETALWSSTDESNEQGGDPMDKNYSVDDIDPETRQQAEQDCEAFCQKAGALLDGLDMIQVGHDFWLTRNGHGAGFWDGDYEKEIGEKLTQISKEFGQKDLYVGDDGKIHSSVVTAAGQYGQGYEKVVFESPDKHYRILEMSDEDYRIEDLKGDVFKPDVNPDLPPEQLAQEEKDFEKQIEDEGVFGYELQKWNPEPGKGWEHVDSIWGFVGQYDPNDEHHNHYIIDEMKAQIPGLEKSETQSALKPGIKFNEPSGFHEVKRPIEDKIEDLERKRDQAHQAGDLRKADRYDKMLENLMEESEEGAA